MQFLPFVASVLVVALAVGPVVVHADPAGSSETIDETPIAPAGADPEAIPEVEPEAVPAEPVPAAPGPADRVVSGIRGDVVGGGWIAAALLYGTASTIARTSRGEEPGGAARNALKDLTRTEFLLGSLVAGSAGAALGAALPMPAILTRAPLFLRTLGAAAAPLFLASAFSTVATNAISLHRRRQLTVRNLMKSIDIPSFAWQTVGSLIGMTLGATMVAMKFAPAWSIGAVALVPLAGGITGAIGGAHTLNWLRRKHLKTEDAASASTGASPTGPDVPPSSRGSSNPGRAPGPVPDVAIIDPMIDIHVAEPPVRAR